MTYLWSFPLPVTVESSGKDDHLMHNENILYLVVGLGRVVRKVRQHPDVHEFESQRWQ
jgi:hypothetical protein